jgi:4-amino-4-deoxy-L-arabinose transferase-like glycosyltransferase
MLQQASHKKSYASYFICILIIVLALRLFVLIASPLNLHGDEAQYWVWSQNLDWGYFSKPPLIAWIIAVSTAVLGQAEWAIRLPSVFIHGLTAWVIFLTAQKLFDPRTGFWAGCIYFLMPAVWLSSMIISTDVPLLLCWALALNAWVALREKATLLRAAQLGLALGFGLLAKYAMLFFLPVLLLGLIFDKQSRIALLGSKGLLAISLAVALFLPNIFWNLSNDLATVAHTADNASLSGFVLKPSELLSFFGDQFGVFGPLSFPILLGALFFVKSMSRSKNTFHLYLWSLALLPLVIISVQALLSRANANWAVTAYIAGSILIAAIAMGRPRVFRFLRIGVIAQSLLMMIMGFIILIPALADSFGLSNSIKRVRGWPETVSSLEAAYDTQHEGVTFEAIATDSRRIFYNLTYYKLPETAPLYMWRRLADARNHAEKFSSLSAMDGPILLVNYNPANIDLFKEDFEKLYRLPPIEVELGGGKKRQLALWAGYNYRPPQNRTEK